MRRFWQAFWDWYKPRKHRSYGGRLIRHLALWCPGSALYALVVFGPPLHLMPKEVFQYWFWGVASQPFLYAWGEHAYFHYGIGQIKSVDDQEARLP